MTLAHLAPELDARRDTPSTLQVGEHVESPVVGEVHGRSRGQRRFVGELRRG